MRILAIGDIHGCSRALDVLLEQVQPGASDLLITLGDYVDRGPDSYGVIDRLLTFRKRGRLIALRGNHDLMMVEARLSHAREQEWLGWGGDATLASYGHGGTLADVPDYHWEFLELVCVDWHEIDTHFFVHANAAPDLPLGEQPPYMLFYEKLEHPRPHQSGKIMVCGHTAQRSGVPLDLGHTICIDTWIYGEGWLTCLDVHKRWIWQANQAGDWREGPLADFALTRLEEGAAEAQSAHRKKRKRRKKHE